MTITDSDREAILEAWSAAYPYAPLKRSAPFPPGIEESYLAGLAAGARCEHALLQLLRRWYDTYGGSTNGRGGKLVDAKLDADTLRELGDAP